MQRSGRNGLIDAAKKSKEKRAGCTCSWWSIVSKKNFDEIKEAVLLVEKHKLKDSTGRVVSLAGISRIIDVRYGSKIGRKITRSSIQRLLRYLHES